MPYTAVSQTFLMPSLAAHQQQQQLQFDQGLRQWPSKRVTLAKRNASHDYMGTSNLTFVGIEQHAHPQPIPNSAHRTTRTGSSPSGSPRTDLQTMFSNLKVSPSSSPSPPARRASYASSPSRPSPLQLRAEEVVLPRTLSSGDLTSSPMLRKKSGEVVKPSLKRGTKSAPPTPTCPKYVHFDTQLEHVRLFLQAETPQAVKEDAEPVERDENLPEVTFTLANWPAPSTVSNVSKMVFVESIVFSDDKSALNGRVQVQNIAFHKTVTIRYTFDYWQTVHESQAAYKDSINKDSFDRFIFNISLVGKVGQGLAPEDEQRTMYFAVRYNVEGREFWDNNGGMNYQVEFKRIVTAPKPKIASWSMDTPESKAAANEQRSTILATSPPTLSLSPSNEALPLKKKPLANRYDFGASLSATKKVVVPTNAPTAPAQNARRNKPFPAFYPGVTTASSIVDGYPTSFGLSDEYLASSIVEQPMHSAWDERGSMHPGMRTTEFSSYGSSPATTPISIPKSRPPAGSTGYFDLVNKYCFYGANNASTYSSSPYSSSPPAPLIRG
ncbi:putative phosphatase regulatory subunit-domain-containing protein [Jimgerdemannia flammicorona]|uniref:Putative phosphatase regulatory subunit-domain-containing protein n=1 Tax=Jimgerdemannia flammicorona TaxID=994334 RepID=A0A433PRB0_9FUNG|nr:putative phosphatase regulatory subunit-domain-containing protein [Jimgerdemannia flammicorona]